MFIVGVDVAKRSHEATVIDDAGNRIKKPFNFKSDSSGFHIKSVISTVPGLFHNESLLMLIIEKKPQSTTDPLRIMTALRLA